MTSNLASEPAPPVGVIESLTSGFETVAARVGLILLPLMLDVFLWLGPRLSVQPLAYGWLAEIANQPVQSEVNPERRQAIRDMLSEFGDTYNVFALLSTAPLGLPSLMVFKAPTQTPLGTATSLIVASELELATLLLGFSLIGLLLGAAYFSLIAGQLQDGEAGSALRPFVKQVWVNWARLVAFVALLLILGMLFGMPLLIVIALLGLLSPMLANIALSLAAAAAIWFLFYVGFVVHGITLKNQGLFSATWNSIRIVQWNLPAVIGLFALIVLINWGLGYLWTRPAADTWLLLAGIVGHAYIATGLVTATFVFYNDRYRWWSEVREQRLKLKLASKRQDRNR